MFTKSVSTYIDRVCHLKYAVIVSGYAVLFPWDRDECLQDQFPDSRRNVMVDEVMTGNICSRHLANLTRRVAMSYQLLIPGIRVTNKTQ
jgi:hypothetical protein